MNLKPSRVMNSYLQLKCFGISVKQESIFAYLLVFPRRRIWTPPPFIHLKKGFCRILQAPVMEGEENKGPAPCILFQIYQD